MARAGRKRRSGNREPNGRIQRERKIVDETLERLMKHRTEITGRKDLSADYPLSILLGRQLITQEQHDAGMKFAATYWRMYGKPFGRVIGYEKFVTGSFSIDATTPTPPEPDDPDYVNPDLRDKHSYNRSLRELARVDEGARAVIHEIAVHLQRGWLVDGLISREGYYHGELKHRYQRRIALIQRALQALVDMGARKVHREMVAA